MAQIERAEMNRLGGIDDGFVQQHYRDAVFNRINPATLGTFEKLPVVLQRQGLVARGTDEHSVQVRGDHGEHSSRELISNFKLPIRKP
jgi:hypothetical protein